MQITRRLLQALEGVSSRASSTLPSVSSTISSSSPLTIEQELIDGDTFAPGPIANIILRHIQNSSSPLSSSPSSSSLTPVSIPNPFLHQFNKSSKRTSPPAIPLRIQAELARSYPVEILPKGPKTPEGSSVIDYIGDGVQVTFTEEPSAFNHSEKRAEEEGGKKDKRRTDLPGPYKGRKIQFKGKKVDRRAKTRKADTVERIEGMDKRVQDWRQVSWRQPFRS